MNTHSIKTNSNKGDFKTESSYQKRKSYQVPTPKLAKAKTEEADDNSKIDIDEEENRAQTEKLKEEEISNLLFNAQRQCIENVKADIQKEQQGKDYQIVEKKLKTLETNGEVLNVENLTNKDEDEEETEEKDEGIEEQQETDQQKENIETDQEVIKGEGQEIDNDDNSRLESRENKLTTMNNENTSKISIRASKNQSLMTKSNSVDSKQKRKERVESLEYVYRINQVRGKNEGESFRHGKSAQKQTLESKECQIDDRTNHVYDYEGNYEYSTKKPLTPKQREKSKQYMKEQQQKRKEKERKEIEEKQKKAIKKFTKLAELDETIRNIRIKSVANTRSREPNEMYQGKRNQRSSSVSTEIDPNSFVQNMAETRMIIQSGSMNAFTNENTHPQIGKEEYDNFISQEEEEAKNGNIDINDIDKENFAKKSKSLSSKRKNKDNSSGILDEKMTTKVQQTLKKATELQASENLRKMLNDSFNKYKDEQKQTDKSASIHSVQSIRKSLSESRYEEHEKNDEYEEHEEDGILTNQENNNNQQTELVDNAEQQPSIQVPSTIHQSNLVSITNEYKKESSEIPDIYQESKLNQEKLHEYEDKFEQLADIINHLQMKSFYQSYIILRNYIILKARYHEGIRHMIAVMKFFPFSQLMNDFNYNQYDAVIKGLIAPFMRRNEAHFLEGLLIKAKCQEGCNILKHIIKFQFLRRLIFYIEARDEMRKLSLKQLSDIYEKKQKEFVFAEIKQYKPEVSFYKDVISNDLLNYPKSQNESFISNKENDNLSNSYFSLDSKKLNQTDIEKPKKSLQDLLKEKPTKMFKKLSQFDQNKKLSLSLNKSQKQTQLPSSPFDQDISADKDGTNIEWEDSMQYKSSSSNRDSLKYDNKLLTPSGKKDLSEKFDKDKSPELEGVTEIISKKSDEEIMDVKIERPLDLTSEKKKNESFEEKGYGDFDNFDEIIEDENNDSETIVKQIQNENNKSRNNAPQKDPEQEEKKQIEEIMIQKEIEEPIEKENDKNIGSERSDEIIIIDKNDTSSKIFPLSDQVSQVTDLVDDQSTGKQPQFIKNSVSISTSTKLNKRYEEDEVVEEKKTPSIFASMEKKDMEKLADDIADEIIKSLLTDEIKKDEPLVHKKNKSLDSPSLQMSQQSNSGSLGNNSPRSSLTNKDAVFTDNFSTGSSFSSQSEQTNSIFMRTVREIRKEVTLNLYNEKIAPKFITTITDNINNNWPKIVQNLSEPYKFNGEDVMNRIMLNDKDFLNKIKGRFSNQNEIDNNHFVSKEVVSKFEPVSKELRNNNNLVSDGYYDNILNECLVDAANEIIAKERLYSTVGEPLPWSDRTREVRFKYGNNETSKKKMTTKVNKKLNELLNFKMGLIPQNHDYLDNEQLVQDRETKFIKSIKEELQEDEENWKVFETEETLIKLILSKIIMGQLLNEVVEILEHVQLSRRDPNKYNSKSIYACEDIPRLSFQNTTENITNTNEENDNINQ